MTGDPIIERPGVGVAHVELSEKPRQCISSAYGLHRVPSLNKVSAGSVDLLNRLGNERKVVSPLQIVFPVAGGVVSEWITIPATHDVIADCLFNLKPKSGPVQQTSSPRARRPIVSPREHLNGRAGSRFSRPSGTWGQLSRSSQA